MTTLTPSIATTLTSSTTLKPFTTATLSTTSSSDFFLTRTSRSTTSSRPASTVTFEFDFNAGAKRTTLVGALVGVFAGLFFIFFCVGVWLHFRKERAKKAAAEKNARDLQDAAVAPGEAEIELERRVVGEREEGMRPYYDASRL